MCPQSGGSKMNNELTLPAKRADFTSGFMEFIGNAAVLIR